MVQLVLIQKVCLHTLRGLRSAVLDDGCISRMLLCAACVSSVSGLLTEVNYGALALFAQQAAADCTYTAVHTEAHAALFTLFPLCEGRELPLSD